MKTYEQGVADEQDRVIALFDQYDITELLGGAIMLVPKVEPKKWQGMQHKTGSLSSYIRNGCRCDACKAFVSSYYKERKVKK